MIEVYPTVITELNLLGEVVGTYFSVIAKDDYETHNVGSFESTEEMLSTINTPVNALNFLENEMGLVDIASHAKEYGFKLCGVWYDSEDIQ
jgi:hypothetical protein